MPIDVVCACGARFAVRDALAGHDVECVTCGDLLRIPRTARQARPAQPQPAQPQEARGAPPREPRQAQARSQPARPQRAAPQPSYVDDPVDPEPTKKPWKLIAGFGTMVAALAVVFYVTNGKITDLRGELDSTRAALEESSSASAAGFKAATQARDSLAEVAAQDRERAEEAEKKLQAKYDEQVEAHEELSASLDRTKLETSGLKDEIAVKSREIEAVKARGEAVSSQLTAQLASLEESLRKKQQKQDRLEKDLAQVTTDLRLVETDLDEARRETDAKLKTLKDDLTAEINQLRTDMTLQEARVASLEKSLEGAVTKAEKDRIRQELDSATKLLTDMQTRMDAASRDRDFIFDRAEERNRELSQKVDQLALAAMPKWVSVTGVWSSFDFRVALRMDSTNGKTIRTQGGSPNSTWLPAPLTRVVQEPATPGTQAERGLVPGRYVIQLRKWSNGEVREAVRLDTRSGRVWRCPLWRGPPSKPCRWTVVNNFQLTNGSNPIGTWQMHLVKKSSRAEVIVIMNCVTGAIWSDGITMNTLSPSLGN